MSKYNFHVDLQTINVEGIDQIPTHWMIKQVRYLLQDGANGIKIGPFGSALKIEDMIENGYSVYGQENVIQRNFDLGKRKISETKFKEMSVYRIFPEDILITMMGTSGKCEIVPQDINDGIIDSHLLRLRVKSNLIIPSYFKLLIDESPEVEYQIKVYGKGSIMHGLNSGIVKSLNLPIPSIHEQSLILKFLNYETAKIDSLIEKQKQLIQLLKEKRQAVISHTVTKGLDPSVKVKDSGVEWLGEVPEHWEIAKLSYKYEVLLGKMLDEGKITGKYLGSYLRNTDVQWDEINTENLPKMDFRPSEISRYSVSKGDLIVCEGGEIGRCAIWEKDSDCFYQKALHRLRPYQKNDLPRFMFYILYTSVHSERFISAAGKATIAHLPAEAFRQYRFAFPPLIEQKLIISYLDQQKKYFDELESKANGFISLLQERRTALISAAVTGKIDVRNWRNPIDAKTELSA